MLILGVETLETIVPVAIGWTVGVVGSLIFVARKTKEMATAGLNDSLRFRLDATLRHQVEMSTEEEAELAANVAADWRKAMQRGMRPGAIGYLVITSIAVVVASIAGDDTVIAIMGLTAIVAVAVVAGTELQIRRLRAVEAVNRAMLNPNRSVDP